MQSLRTLTNHLSLSLAPTFKFLSPSDAASAHSELSLVEVVVVMYRAKEETALIVMSSESLRIKESCGGVVEVKACVDPVNMSGDIIGR